jgi:hypothetical protein
VHDASVSPAASRAPRAPLGTVCLIGVLLTGVVLSACGSSKNAGSTSATSATTAASSATTSGGSSTGGGTSDASQLQSLSSAVQSGEHASYKAVYTSQSSTGAAQTITIEQMPPKSVFSTTSGSVIDDGTHTYFCSASGAAEQCVTESSGGANPFASITALFSPTTLLNEFHAAEGAAAAHTAGYSVAFSSGSYAGLAAKCLDYTAATQTVKYCVTDTGLLAYAQSTGGTFELTSFSSSPAAGDFSLPPGATVVTIPDVSLPSSP